MSTTVDTETIVPKVWIGCLQCYNNGRLTGDWYDAIEAAAVTTNDLHGREIPEGTHEELWCLDHECIPVTGEMSPATATEWAEMIESVEEWLRAAFLAWVESGSYVAQGTGDLPSVTDFYEAYCGEYASFRDYAESLVEDTGMMQGWSADAQQYFDYAAWTRDLALDYFTADAPDTGVYVFHNP